MRYFVLFSGLAILIGLFIWGVISYKFPTYPQMQTYEDVIDYASKYHIALPDTQALKDSALAYYRQSMEGETRILSLSIMQEYVSPDDETHPFSAKSLKKNDFRIQNCHIDKKNQIVYFYLLLKKENYIYTKPPYPSCKTFSYTKITIAYYFPTKTLKCFTSMDWDIPKHRYNFRDFIAKSGIGIHSHKEYVKILDDCYRNRNTYCENFNQLQHLVRSYWSTTYYDSLYNDTHILPRKYGVHYSAIRAVNNIYILAFYDSISNNYQVLPIIRPYPELCSGDFFHYESYPLRKAERKHKYP